MATQMYCLNEVSQQTKRLIVNGFLLKIKPNSWFSSVVHWNSGVYGIHSKRWFIE